MSQSAASAAQAQPGFTGTYPAMPKLCSLCIVLAYRISNRTASTYSAPIPSPESSSGISRFMPRWIRQARARSLQLPGRVLRLREVPGSTWQDLQSAASSLQLLMQQRHHLGIGQQHRLVPGPLPARMLFSRAAAACGVGRGGGSWEFPGIDQLQADV